MAPSKHLLVLFFSLIWFLALIFPLSLAIKNGYLGLEPTLPAVQSIAEDFDLDGTTDIVLIDSSQRPPIWRVRSTAHLHASPLGKTRTEAVLSTDVRAREFLYRQGFVGGIPLSADFNGDGLVDLASFNPNYQPQGSLAGGNWAISPSYSEDGYVNPGEAIFFSWGGEAVIPVPSDYDGDGSVDLAVFDLPTGTWRILYTRKKPNLLRASLSKADAGEVHQWGLPADYPIAMDFDGDGKTDFGLWRPGSPSRWLIKFSSEKESVDIAFGGKDDVPLPADYDCDGVIDLAVYSTASKNWLIYKDGKAQELDNVTGDGIPVAKDFDGDSCVDPAFYTSGKEIKWRIYRSRFSDDLKSKFDYKSPAVLELNWGGASYIPPSWAKWEHWKNLQVVRQ
ncbi:hypothetical protein BVY02_01775 [bacterium J17]|nr:hypothetical protein BVY02_01775 [bacterium J17]